MSNLSKKEFAELCGMESRKLAIYIKRGKVIVEKNNYINTKNEVNGLFIARHNSQSKETKEVPDRKKPAREKVEEGKDVDRMELLQLEKEKKKADLKNSDVVFRINLLKEEKMMGSAMPVDMVKAIVANISKSFIGEFKNGADDIIRMLVKSKAYDKKEVAAIRGGLATIINESMRKSISLAKREMKTVVENYTETRGVGEHD